MLLPRKGTEFNVCVAVIAADTHNTLRKHGSLLSLVYKNQEVKNYPANCPFPPAPRTNIRPNETHGTQDTSL